jgi:hypothetical protein
MFKLYRLIVLASFGMACMFFQGCTIYSDFYIVNASSQPVTAIIKFSTPVQQILSSMQGLDLRFSYGVMKVNDNTQDLLKSDLSYVTIDSQTISIRVPPNSTALIGRAYNRPLAADSFRFDVNGRILEYSLRSISKELKKTGGVFPPVHFTYIVENENSTSNESGHRAY